MADRPWSVTQVTRTIKRTLEAEFPPIWVVGELAEYRQHSSGHRYFTLKDARCQLQCVMWSSYDLSGFEPVVGLQVLARGRLSVYERRGQVQLSATQLLPAGVGQQQIALEALKRRLREEGLFDETAKRPLPDLPRAIGIVTSRSGAAFRDILTVLKRRFPGTRVVLRSALVQGEGAAEDIAQGIAEIDTHGGVDVVIVGRGGGASEDLAAFNTEVVVRSIRASEVPVISAVGHEIDFTLTDFAADCRAPTPSAAAELAVPDRDALRAQISKFVRRAAAAMTRLMSENASILEHYEARYGLRRVDDLIAQHAQLRDELVKDLHTGFERIFGRCAARFHRSTSQLETLSPLGVLNRGYSLTQRLEDDAVVQDARSLSEGARLRTRFAKGEVTATVDDVRSG